MQMKPSPMMGNGPEIVRIRTVIRGAVQGVGFRPFVYRLATEMKLVGWVSNSGRGVFIEIEGPKELLQRFLLRVHSDKPKIAFIQSIETTWLDSVGYSEFSIRESEHDGEKSAFVLPDIATCPECLEEIFDPDNRRHLYPFTNCTNCGPRFTIIESLPYDRSNTSMRAFVMCPECRREYEDPGDRRFHAQPNACPVCGPHIELWDGGGVRRATNLQAILEAVEALKKGRIVAVKGLGGFHLFADAGQDEVVGKLRERKRREEKPFALMYPSLEHIKQDCHVSEAEQRLLCSSESPIVLLHRNNGQRRGGSPIDLVRLAENVAPSNPYLGIMLPYTPLHHILMRELRAPMVATSGNLSDEPICTDEREAVKRLGGIADLFLVHDRPIVRHVDDSIVRIVLDRELVLRRSRGYAPLPVVVQRSLESPVVAVGAHLKNTVAIGVGNNVFVSQHIGDLETSESLRAFERATEDLARIYELGKPQFLSDLHPDYLSSKFVRNKNTHYPQFQHHYAHIASCMAENQIDGPVLGVGWDGTGYGLDGSVWGGEFLVTNEVSFRQRATFRQFKLPGADVAVKEPRRSALGALYEMFGNNAFTLEQIHSVASFTREELGVIGQMLAKNLNSPRTSSVGRLFDVAASVLGVRQVVRFEGQAAMELEFLTSNCSTEEQYPFEVIDSGGEHGVLQVDWRPMIAQMIEDAGNARDRSHCAATFHNTLVAIIVHVARRIGIERVVLSGGCFQNAYLLEHCVSTLRKSGFRPYWHQRIPPNDGGISLGQVYAFLRLKSASKEEEALSSAENCR